LEIIVTNFTRAGVKPVVASLTLAALFAATTFTAFVPQTVAKEYKVKEYRVKEYKVKVRIDQASGVRKVHVRGTSPYVCTPSGFGQKARCRLREAV
jgi:ssDNA-binding replication factor A large subunit